MGIDWRTIDVWLFFVRLAVEASAPSWTKSKILRSRPESIVMDKAVPPVGIIAVWIGPAWAERINAARQQRVRKDFITPVCPKSA